VRGEEIFRTFSKNSLECKGAFGSHCPIKNLFERSSFSPLPSTVVFLARQAKGKRRKEEKREEAAAMVLTILSICAQSTTKASTDAAGAPPA
jgi:hypothetical protein